MITKKTTSEIKANGPAAETAEPPTPKEPQLDHTSTTPPARAPAGNRA